MTRNAEKMWSENGKVYATPELVNLLGTIPIKQ